VNLKILSCTQLDSNYRALTFGVLAQQFSALATVYRRVEFFRNSLSEDLKVPLIKIFLYEALLIWTFDRQFLVLRNCNAAAFLYINPRDFGHALILAKLIVVFKRLVYDKVEKDSDLQI